MSAIEKATCQIEYVLDVLEEDGYSQELLGGARAELAALRATVEAQAKQIETMKAALKEHKHTDECLRYAAATGHAYCIAACADSRRKALSSAPSTVAVVPVEDIYARTWQLMDAARPDQTLGDIRGQLVAEFGEDGVERAAAAIRGAEREKPESEETIEDGFGGAWSKRCPECGRLSMQVVRPGKAQCGYCG